jgi:hypothetical protein
VHRRLEGFQLRADVVGGADAGEFAVVELVDGDADGVAGVGVDLFGVLVSGAGVVADVGGELFGDGPGGEDVVDEADGDVVVGAADDDEEGQGVGDRCQVFERRAADWVRAPRSVAKSWGGSDMNETFGSTAVKVRPSIATWPNLSRPYFQLGQVERLRMQVLWRQAVPEYSNLAKGLTRLAKLNHRVRRGALRQARQHRDPVGRTIRCVRAVRCNRQGRAVCRWRNATN